MAANAPEIEDDGDFSVRQVESIDAFSIKRQLGKGSSGVAVLAVERATGRVYVVKQINLALSRQHGFADEKVFEEAKLMLQNGHLNIVAVFSSFLDNSPTTGERFNIVMAFCDCGTLREAIQARQGLALGGRLSNFTEQEVIRVLAQIVVALKLLHHRNIIHRDIKPANIFFMSGRDNRQIVKLGDFGLARQFDHSADLTLSAMGTPMYMAPEILSGQGCSFNADIWSLGIVAYEMITLQQPFSASNIFSLSDAIRNQHCGEGLRRLITDKMLVRDTKKRAKISDIADDVAIRDSVERAELKAAEYIRQLVQREHLQVIDKLNKRIFELQQRLETSSIPCEPEEPPRIVPSGRRLTMTDEELQLDEIRNSLFVAAHLREPICKVLSEELISVSSLLSHYKEEDIKDIFPQRGLCDAVLNWRRSYLNDWECNKIPALGEQLRNAGRDGDLALVREILTSQNLPPNGRQQLLENQDSQSGQNVLDFAVLKGHLAVVEFLVSQEIGANPDAIGTNGRTPLMVASSKGYREIVKFLIETAKVNIEFEDSHTGMKAIHLAVLSGDVGTVAYLLDRKPEWLEVKSTKYGRTPLLHAVASGNLALVKFLLEIKKASLDDEDAELKCKAIHLAAALGNVDLVAYLLEKNQVILEERSRKSDRTALLYAAGGGHLALVKYLVEEKGANLEAESAVLNAKAIHLAAALGNVGTVEYFLERKPKWLEIKGGNDDFTPLLQAAESGNVAVVRFLIEQKGANLEATDGSGRRAIHLAAEFGNVETVAYLLDRVPDLLEKKSSRYMNTPLLHAAKSGNLAVVRYLVEQRRANIKAVEFHWGDSALHLAAHFGQLDTVGYLVDRYPEMVKMANTHGDTPLVRAVGQHQHEVVKLLLRKGE